jgi:hypothetical protein
LRANVGNIALLQRAQACGLLPAPVGEAAAAAYRALRQLQHRARLDEAPTQVAQGVAEQERAAGLALYLEIYESNAAPAHTQYAQIALVFVALGVPLYPSSLRE